MKRCTVIFNPKSGKGISEKNLKKIKKILYDNNYEPTIIKSEYQGHIKQIIEKLEYTDLVISIGGDGTFNEIVSGNLKRHNELLISHLPVGTANDIGSMYGYKKTILTNLKMLLKGKIKNIDICSINGNVFTYSAGFGKFTDISYNTPRKLKKRLGYSAYLINALKELTVSKTKLYNLKIMIDNKVYNEKCSLILISNSNRIGGIKDFYKTVKLDDGEFEILICNLIDKRKILNSLVLLMTKDATSVPGFKVYKAKYMKIWFEDERKKTFTIDGEKYQDNRKDYEIKVLKKSKILIPKKNINKLFGSD